VEKTTFGEWLRWTIARRGIERASLARHLQCSAKTITNLYSRETPIGVTDVFVSRLADLLGMTEPELMVRWKDGLPTKEPRAAEASKKNTAKKSRR
jgi:plasmid maintenance system antidote protein VapI